MIALVAQRRRPHRGRLGGARRRRLRRLRARRTRRPVKHREAVRKKTPATYVIKSGDTLTAIAHTTGVGVAKIERLNPEVDPQILIAGETLKLK